MLAITEMIKDMNTSTRTPPSCTSLGAVTNILYHIRHNITKNIEICIKYYQV